MEIGIDYNALKKGGFLKQKQKGYFIMRLRTLSGNLSSEQLRHAATIAEKYGRGEVHVTTRQGLEIPWVRFEDFEALNQDLAAGGLRPGTCGPRIRAVVACPGTSVCGQGLEDARYAGELLDQKFFGREVPIKTKLAVSGCPNSCSKPQENDIGFMGAVEPLHESDLCSGCGICVEVCPTGSITMGEDNLPIVDLSSCLGEGNCITSCPSDAWVVGRHGFHLFAGGKIGKFPRLGEKFLEFVPQESISSVTEAVLDVFSHLRKGHERLGATLSRIGAAAFRKALVEELEGEQTMEKSAVG